MITTVIEWDGRQNIVSIRDDAAVIDIPLDTFLKLPAVRYVIAVAVEQADLLPSATVRHSHTDCASQS
jgi:hypothetical protein